MNSSYNSRDLRTDLLFLATAAGSEGDDLFGQSKRPLDEFEEDIAGLAARFDACGERDEHDVYPDEEEGTGPGCEEKRMRVKDGIDETWTPLVSHL